MMGPMGIERCAWCGTLLPKRVGPGRPRLWCSDAHRQQAYQARVRGVDLNDVGDLDDWTCYLCRGPVDRTMRMPAAGAPTVEHVLPGSRGGNDHPTNLRLAHYACNLSKGDRYVPPEGPPPGSTPDLRFDSVSKPVGERRCRWCGRAFAVAAGPGRPAEFCRRSCRQREYEARRRSNELGLGEAELVIARAELEQLRDALYVLEAAVEDVDRDLAAAGDDPEEVRRALDWLLQAARPLLGLRP